MFCPMLLNALAYVQHFQLDANEALQAYSKVQSQMARCRALDIYSCKPSCCHHPQSRDGILVAATDEEKDMRILGYCYIKRRYTATAEAKTLNLRSCILQLRGLSSGGLIKVSGGLFPAWVYTILKFFRPELPSLYHVLSFRCSWCSPLCTLCSSLCTYPVLPTLCSLCFPPFAPFSVLSNPSTPRCLPMYYPCLSVAAEHKVSGVLKNKVTYTATAGRKRL
jgi:hypothetical protein